MSKEPLLPGPVGWVTQSHPPEFDPERPGPLDWTVRHIPAALRVYGAIARIGAPRMSESDAYSAVRALTDQHVRMRPTGTRAQRHPQAEAVNLVTWLRCVPYAASWWKSNAGWRSPREFVGWRVIENESGFAHMEPFEIGQLRLPEDVVMDADVVLLQAWCQGITNHHMAKHVAPNVEAWKDWPTSIRAGLFKLHASPYVKFALAAPHLPPMGIRIGSADLIGSAVRMETLLRHPYTATLPELADITSTPMFTEAYAKATRLRKKGQYTNPDGGWYACGTASALGQWFRRGATWTTIKRGAA